ncbi:hypothetical protein U7230_08970 [Carboxydochorda subterranea]|uniref:Uncharacterized protein n=1 Tax=Carboxydichorda subterranea TaxID=3109565 RepID=A0ABZ1BTY2_9FIRM|nr:hypothetical protein [Limnochorda sp. L945t]WRP16234.1 hypothetical protein U7230_08970 [Limnochorda sp. L945t]
MKITAHYYAKTTDVQKEKARQTLQRLVGRTQAGAHLDLVVPGPGFEPG